MSPAAPADGRSFAEISIGDALTPYPLTLTLQRLVMEAGANRDFARIHHDPDVARASGAPAVYANTTFIETMLEAGVRSWAGLAPRIRMLEFTMKDFNCVGDEISAGGQVKAKDTGEPPTVTLEVWVKSDRGRTVEGAAVVEFTE